MKEALRLLAAEDERQAQLHDILETIREQIRLEVPPEHRPDGLFKNIQDAVYAMRGRTPLMNDAAIIAAIDRIDVPSKTAGELKPWRVELDEVIGHLGAAVIQSTSSDDQIIMDHIKAAHEIAKIVRRQA
jgi:hypothetical protein